MTATTQPMDIQDVLAFVNERHGASWALVGKLPGGYLQGAYELRDDRGTRAVVKWHREISAERLLRTARLVEVTRARGWPTSTWVAYGALADGGGYIVEEFIEGEQPTKLTDDMLQRLLTANRLQADARPDTDQNWSEYIHNVVFEDEGDLAARMAQHPDTARLLGQLRQLTMSSRNLRLPTNDFVHGDFVLRNMIVKQGHPCVIDAASAGKGTRAYDLACLLLETSVDDIYSVPSLDQRTQLERECLRIVGRSTLLVCVACRMMHWLVFGDAWPKERLPALVKKCEAFLDSLGEVT